MLALSDRDCLSTLTAALKPPFFSLHKPHSHFNPLISYPLSLSLSLSLCFSQPNMTFATTALFKPTGCLSSHPTLLTTKASHPFLSLPSKPSKLHFSSPYSSLSWLSPLKSKISSSSVVSLIAQTSNFAQQNEETQVEELGINLESEETEEAHLSDLEGEEGEESGEESYSEPSEEAKLFVGNLHYEIDSEKLAQLLEQAGVVEIAEVIYNRETDRSRGFGFVTMSTVEEAEKAVEMFNGYDLNGRLLTVNKASPRGSRPERPPQTVEPLRIYIGNLPWQVDDDRLEQIFTEHGKVVDAKIVYDRETGRSRGFGFVTMSTLAEVDDAVAALDGQSLDGRAIRVNVAEKPRRNSF